MPKLGAYTEDVLLARWLVEEGEEVEPGRVVFELETDKTNAEVEAESAGWLHRLVPAGQTVPIGTTVALVAETREEYDALAAGGAADRAPEDAHPFLGYIGHGGGATVAQTAGSVAPTRARPAPAPRPAPTGATLVSPRARALLRELGFTLDDAREIAGSGPAAVSSTRDVTAWAAGREPAAEPTLPDALTVARTIPLRGRRGTIATRMVSSLQTAAQLTSVLELDVKPLVELRTRLNEAGASPRIGVTSIVVKLVAAALREHPGLNARVTETEIEVLEEINVAVAVETDEGLVAPVVAGADLLSLEEINARIAELARPRARSLADSRRSRRRHVHRLERRHPPGRHHDGHPQPAPGRDPLDRPYPRSPRRARGRRDRRPADDAGVPHVRPSRGRRRSGRDVPRYVRGIPSPAWRSTRRDYRDHRRRDAARPLPDDAHDPALRAAGGTRVPYRRDSGLRAHVHRRGGRRCRRLREPRRRRLRDEHPSRPRPLHRQGLRARADDGRDLRARGRAAARGAAARCTSPTSRAGCSVRTRSSAAASPSRPAPGSRRASAAAGRSRLRSSATARRTRASSTRASTWRRSGSCRSSTSARTTASRSRRPPPTRRACRDVASRCGRPTGSRASSPTARTCATSTAAAQTAVERARAGEGPTLLEVKTYRFSGHFEGDPDRYRDDDDRRTTRERDALATAAGRA